MTTEHWLAEIICEDLVEAQGDAPTPEQAVRSAIRQMLELSEPDADFLADCAELLRKVESADDHPETGYLETCGDFSGGYWQFKVSPCDTPLPLTRELDT